MRTDRLRVVIDKQTGRLLDVDVYAGDGRKVASLPVTEVEMNPNCGADVLAIKVVILKPFVDIEERDRTGE